ncbi:Endonuclease MutS2 [bioreactor metagenome]|uniref:Endonuclease MutS2 n=2 Tax=root TaxID=1 RepID=A0A645HG31_9ZZZZ
MDQLDSMEEATKKDEGQELKTVNVGEEVFLPSLNQKVIILTKPDNRGEVQVQAGIMKISVKVKDLRAANGVSREEKKIKKREAKLNLRSVESSIDLRGLDAEEAVYNTDKYLDEAYMAGLGSVTVIHGKGTGILRKAIHDMLKRHPHVKTYRIGAYGEGGEGATIAELK